MVIAYRPGRALGGLQEYRKVIGLRLFAHKGDDAIHRRHHLGAFLDRGVFERGVAAAAFQRVAKHIEAFQSEGGEFAQGVCVQLDAVVAGQAEVLQGGHRFAGHPALCAGVLDAQLTEGAEHRAHVTHRVAEGAAQQIQALVLEAHVHARAGVVTIGIALCAAGCLTAHEERRIKTLGQRQQCLFI